MRSPWWKTHLLRQTRTFAERFYAAALGQGQPVGAVLLAERQKYDPADTTTPLAYIYYGHPLVKLDYQTTKADPPASPEPHARPLDLCLSGRSPPEHAPSLPLP